MTIYVYQHKATKLLALSETTCAGEMWELIDQYDVPDPGEGGGGGGTTNYNALTNRPKIGGETVTGDQTLGKYGDLQDFFDVLATQAVALSAAMPKITMTKGSDTSEVSADTVKVTDGTDSVTATKAQLEVKNGPDVVTVKKNEVKATDGTDTMTATPLKVEVTDGTDVATIKKNEIKVTDGTDTLTETPLKVEVKDADETTSVTKEKVEVKKGAVISTIEDDRASMTDGTHTIAMSPVKATYGEHLKLDGDGVLESWEKVLGIGNFAVIEKTTASKAYAVGSYLLYNGTMYRVTKAISSGGTITTTGANANVEAKRVDEVIAELTAKDTAQDTEIAALANSGAKNILNPNGNAVQTQFGVTFTRNADGSITVSGTATGRAQYTVGTFNLAEGSYRLTGAPSGASQTTHALYERVHPYAAGVALNYDEGSGKNFTVTSATAGTHAVIIDVKSGQTLDNVVYYPMVRNAAITDDTYVPYVMTNAELVKVKADKSEVSAIANSGAKNKFPNASIGQTVTVNGVTFTVNADGSVTVNGKNTATAENQCYITLATSAQGAIKAGTYLMSGVPEGYANKMWTWGANIGQNSTESDKLITVAADRSAAWGITVAVGDTQFDNVTVYPMLRDAAITDDTYVPYAMSNAELTAKKQDAGNYVRNGGAGYAAFNGAYLVCPKDGENVVGMAIRTEYDIQEDGAVVDWLLINRQTKKITHSIYNDTLKRWETRATYSADEDTGWQTLTGTPIKYRRKNGFVSVNIGATSEAYTYNFTKGQWAQLGTLPTGFRPSGGTNNPEVMTIWIRRTSDSTFIPMVCQFASDGIIQVMASETLAASAYNAILGSVSFPV